MEILQILYMYFRPSQYNDLIKKLIILKMKLSINEMISNLQNSE